MNRLNERRIAKRTKNRSQRVGSRFLKHIQTVFFLATLLTGLANIFLFHQDSLSQNENTSTTSLVEKSLSIFTGASANKESDKGHKGRVRAILEYLQPQK